MVGRPITVAELYGFMMRDCTDGEIAVTPVHSDIHPKSLGSIILSPVAGSMYPYALTVSEAAPGPQPRVLVSVRLNGVRKLSQVTDAVVKLARDLLPVVGAVADMTVTGFHTLGPNIGVLLVIPASVWVTLVGEVNSFVSFVDGESQFFVESP